MTEKKVRTHKSEVLALRAAAQAVMVEYLKERGWEFNETYSNSRVVDFGERWYSNEQFRHPDTEERLFKHYSENEVNIPSHYEGRSFFEVLARDGVGILLPAPESDYKEGALRVPQTRRWWSARIRGFHYWYEKEETK